MTVDPFDEGVPRDGRGRPLITPCKRDGTPNVKAKPVAHTRASTFAKALDDGSGLTRWKVRHAIVGLAQSPDLAAMVAAMGRDLNAYSDEDKLNLDAIIERCHDRSGGNAKADYGTAVHALTEPGRDPFAWALDDTEHGRMAASVAGDVDAYERLLAALDVEVVDTETFTVNDDVKTAGTFDHTYRFRSDLVVDGDVIIPAGTVVVIDKKTGTLHLGQHAIQLAIYARGRRYDHNTGERAALDVSPQWGIVVHLPKGKGTAAAYLVDLHAGWEAAKLASKVREYRSNERKLGRVVAEVGPVEPVEPDPATPAIEGAIEVEVVHEGDHTQAPAEPAPVVEAEPATPADHQREDKAADFVAVDEFGDPTPDPSITDAEAVANLARAGLLDDGEHDAVIVEIRRAANGAELRALWGRYRSAWQDKHTDAVKARLAELGEPVAA